MSGQSPHSCLIRSEACDERRRVHLMSVQARHSCLARPPQLWGCSTLWWTCAVLSSWSEFTAVGAGSHEAIVFLQVFCRYASSLERSSWRWFRWGLRLLWTEVPGGGSREARSFTWGLQRLEKREERKGFKVHWRSNQAHIICLFTVKNIQASVYIEDECCVKISCYVPMRHASVSFRCEWRAVLYAVTQYWNALQSSCMIYNTIKLSLEWLWFEKHCVV